VARVYVSSTYSDLRDCREQVRLVLRRMGHEDVAMEHYVAESRRPLARSLEDVASCDLYIGLFAWRYGFIPPGESRSITELELRKAVETGRPCLVFLLQEGAPWPAERFETAELPKIRALRAELASEFLVAFFSNSDNLQARVTEAVAEWERGGRGDPGRPFQAPPLPAHYVERTLATEAIVDSLLSKTAPHSGVLVVSAIHGLGGVGKTTLAIAIAHEPVIRRRYQDGVLWATLGQNPDCLSSLIEWIYVLGDHAFRPTTIAAAAAYLRTLLYRRACLLVVDDVWDAEHARLFFGGGAGCRVLITTRRAHVADELGADLYSLEVMTHDEALALLRRRVEERRGSPLSPAEVQLATALAAATGHLPLALELIAALVARGYSWADAERSLSLGEEPRAGSRHHHRAQERLEAVLQLSLSRLRAENRDAWEGFAWLGVLAEDVVITPAVAATLWEIAEADAARLLDSLVDDAVLQRRRGGAGLHDLMREMARRILQSSAPEGMGVEMTRAHRLLLERYRSRLPGWRWDELPDDGYIQSRLFWHLEAAGDRAAAREVFELQGGDGRRSWYDVRDGLGQSAGFLDDVSIAWRLERAARDPRLSQCGRYALIVASMHSLAEAISPELGMVLLEKGIWSMEKAFEQIRLIRPGSRRADALLKLLGILHGESEAATAGAGGAGWERFHASIASEIRGSVRLQMAKPAAARRLAELAHWLAEPERREVVLEAVALVADSLEALRELARYLPEGARSGVVAEVRRICACAGLTDGLEEILVQWGGARRKAALTASEARDEFRGLLDNRWGARIEEAIALVPYLAEPRESFIEELFNVFDWMDRERCGETLVRLAPLVSPPAAEALANRLVGNGRSSVGVKCLLAMAKSAPEREAMLATVQEDLERIRGEDERERAMIAVARSCPAELVRTLLSAWQRIGDQRDVISTMFMLAPFMRGGLALDSLGGLGEMGDSQLVILTRMVAELASAIKGGALDDFVREAARFSSEWWIVEALTLTILRVDDEDRMDAILRAVQLISASDLRARIIGRIVLRLARLGFRDRALKAACAAPSVLDRWRVLADAVESLASDGLLGTATYLVAEIADAEERSKGQAAVALHLAARGRVTEARLLMGRIRAPHWRGMVATRLELLGNGRRDANEATGTGEVFTDRSGIEAGGIDWVVLRDLGRGLRERFEECGELTELLEAVERRSRDEAATAARSFWGARPDGGSTYLETLAQQPRAMLLQELRSLAPLLTLALEPGEADELAAATRDVARWWP